MKECKLSTETQKALKEVLVDIEKLRIRANENNDYPPSDWPYRPCQAIIAEKLGFEHRAEWSLNINQLMIPKKTENTLVYEKETETIRQMPQNYLIAQKLYGRSWVCDPDLATDKELACRVFMALFDFSTKYGSGENILSKTK